jgi:hypothetical protein
MDRLLKEYGEDSVERFYAAAPQPQVAGGGMVPGTPGFAGQEPGPGGVTAQQSIDPATSPSNQTSMSPEVFNQRALARSGPTQ